MKFEYKQFWLDMDSTNIRRADQTLEALQELGEEGWEVCCKLHEQQLTKILLLKRLKV